MNKNRYKNARKQDADKYGYVVIGTKASPEANALIELIAANRSMSKYELLQMLLDTLIRYLDDTHNLTPDMERAMSIFEHLNNWRNSVNLADPNIKWQVAEATYYLTDSENQKRGCRAVHVQPPMLPTEPAQATYNIQQILERTLCHLLPERYTRLRSLAVDRGCESLLDLLDQLIDEHSKESDFYELRHQFADNRRGDNGRRYEYGARTRRKLNRYPSDGIDTDEVGIFGDED